MAAASSASAPPHLCLPRAALSCRTPFSFIAPRQIPCSYSFARFLVLATPSRTSHSTRIRAIHSLDPDFYKIPYVEGVPVGKKLKLWNLPPNCKHSELLEWFQGVNVTVESLEFTDDPKLNAQGIGGFVELATKQDACIAMVRLDGAKFRGYYIRLDFAEKKPHSRDYGSRRNRSNNSGRSRQIHDSRSHFQPSNAIASASSSLSSRVADTHIPTSSYVNSSQPQSQQNITNFNSNADIIQNHSGHGYGNGSNIGSADNRQNTVETSTPIKNEALTNHGNVVPPEPMSYSPAPSFVSTSGNTSSSMPVPPEVATSVSGISQGTDKDAFKQPKPGPGDVSPYGTNSFRSKMTKESHNGNNPWNNSQGHRESDSIQRYGSSNNTSVQASHKYGPMYGSPRPSSLFRIFVGNLDLSVDDADVQQMFSKYGTVLEARVLKENGRSRGFAVIAMSSAEEVKAATQGLDGCLVGSRNVKVASVVS